MGRLGEFLSRWLSRAPAHSEADAERLRTAFRSRYHSFRLLLDANSKALAIMTELESALSADRPFGMDFVRARCTRITAQVWQMVRHLDDLAPRKYEPLVVRFEEIQGRINEMLRVPEIASGDRLVVPLGELTAADAGEAGYKVGNLGELRNRVGLPVPDGFVVTSAGYRRFMEHGDLRDEINRRLQIGGGADSDLLFKASNEIRQLIEDATLPAELERAVRDGYRRLEEAFGEAVPVAVRSSALDEDLAGASLAGQYRSELNVRGDALIAAFKSVVASKYGLPAMNYRLRRGLPDEDVAMCVGVFPMIDGVAGGVLYTRNPLEPGDDSVIINAAWGLPMPVVEGRIPADLFVVARGTPPEITRREIRDKPLQYVCDENEGLNRREVDDDARTRPSLTDRQVLDLARLGFRLEKHFDAPQDVEWVIDAAGKIVLLQARELRVAADASPAHREPLAAGEGSAVLLRGGTTASRGTASGRVFVVEKEADALRFETGAVMVTVQPLPRWAHLLDRAAAVVAERGSVSGHLANVAREFRVPALFGAEGALSRLPRGETVTVDADGGVIYEGRVESLLTGGSARSVHPLEGSPVYETTRRVSRQIIPLNLLDPDAAEFRAERCSTLHDITRFCHEKAVQEMFRFGKEHRFPERSGKQLFDNVPMQWWVLNLDDGFTEEVQGRFVRLDQIASRPMLDIWAGITAVPWEGPPPIDGRGFMSVVFGATTNRELATGVRSSYVEHNYFMISENYCSLQTRLGAHFAIIEALVSERTADNYVSYQFKGGAADFDRRLKRIALIREILEEEGFRVELTEDSLIARLEGRDAKYMAGRLKILGYLTIHTRQLDMVMSRLAAVDHYRAKLRRDIEAL
jgi:pyruvate,water dikinase